ncbi:MAG: putative entry exclusion protein TrbK-alt [Enhydrobacter sp.]|jgi:conjugative transfer region protein TrbK|nr:MAG: putative entry exclusion protein TrbK-alt [Enhydrobacter sp.]
MREQHDPVRLIIQLSAIALLLATVVLSVGALRDVAIASEWSFIATGQARPDGHEWARCRTVTPEQRPLDEACRRVWADKRRRFFGLDEQVGKASTADTPTTPSQQPSGDTRAESNHPTGSPSQKE